MTRSRPRYELWAIALGSIAAATFFCTAQAVADTEEPQRIALATDLQVFVDSDEPDTSVDSLREAMHRGTVSQWRSGNHSGVEVVSREALRESISEDTDNYQGSLELAREWGEIGIQAYQRVDTRQASEYLERSLRKFDEISHQLIAPEEVSEILMYLALSYLEEGTDVVRPLEVLREMIRRDASRRLQTGYYPEFIVQYYDNARDSLWEELRDDGPPAGESQRIGELVDADYVFHGYGIPTPENAFELTAYLYDVRQQEFLPAERLVVESADEAHIEEGFSRLASRLEACLVEPPESDEPGQVGTSRGTSPLSVQMAMTYGSFLRVPSPIREPFGNYGFGLGASWSITREFRVVGSAYVSNSMRDYSGVLRDNFTTVRLTAGVELGGQFGPLYTGIAAGIEAARIGRIRAFTDRSCLPDPDRLCPGDTGTETFDPEQLHWGVQLRPRLAWPLSDSFELSSSVGVGYYVSPLDGPLLNFPVVTQMGLNYRF